MPKASHIQRSQNQATQNEALQSEALQSEALQSEALQNEALQSEAFQSDASQDQTAQNQAPQNEESPNEAPQDEAVPNDASQNKPSPNKVPARRNVYSVHPAVVHVQSILNNLRASSGRSIGQWTAVVKKSGLTESKAIRDWLKKEHGLGSTTASLVADYACGLGAELTDGKVYLKVAVEYVDAMYSAKKAALRPIHDAIVQRARSLGADVKICPCQTIVPLYRNHVFAQVKPSTSTRVDLGLALKGTKRKLSARLIETGGLAKGDRITHRISLESPEEIDAELESWLRTAYELDG